MTYQKRNSRSNILKWTEQLAQKKKMLSDLEQPWSSETFVKQGIQSHWVMQKLWGASRSYPTVGTLTAGSGDHPPNLWGTVLEELWRAPTAVDQNADELSWKEPRAPVCVACLTCLYFTYSITIHCPYSPYMFCDCLITDGYKSQWCGGTYLDANVQRCLKYLHRNCTGQAHILPLFFAGSVARSCWQAVKPWVNIFRHGSTAIGPSYWAWTWWASIDMPAKLA